MFKKQNFKNQDPKVRFQHMGHFWDGAYRSGDNGPPQGFNHVIYCDLSTAAYSQANVKLA